LDTERLAWALPDTGYRNESPLKYLALWGSQRVNINTAPRHVLEAAFTFGGDAREIAHEIILMRQEEPFKDIDELKTKLYGYSDSIRKVAPYITTTSKFFAVKVTARTGVARASSVATVVREGKNVQRIAVLSD
jgi:type II secretory pathway component PulK